MASTTYSEDNIWTIARVMHEAVRAYQASLGQDPVPHWNKAPRWMRDASYEAVVYRLDNPDAPASAQHEQWMQQKIDDGWKHGKVKDGDKKTHPLLVPYNKLPVNERRKDALVSAVVTSLTSPLPDA